MYGLEILWKQIIQFVGYSGIGWVLDFITYTLLGTVSDDLVLINFISSWVGVTFVFIFSTKTIFQNHSKVPLKAKYLIYLVYQVILITVISILLKQINILMLTNCAIMLIQKLSTIIAKILVTPITMILNFIVMKIMIEKL